MARFKEEIKKEIKEQVGDIVYEKAKEELRNRLKSKYNTTVDKLLSFIGIGETQRQKITRISEEIKKSDNHVLTDQVLGIVELYTINFAQSMVEIASTVATVKLPDQKSSKLGIWKP